MARNNPIQYTSRDFDSVMNDFLSDNTLRDKPIWYARMLAGIVDVISVMINCFVNNLYLSTALTRTAVTYLCQLIDYTLSPQTTSTGYLLFDVNTSIGTAIFPFTVLQTDLKAKSDGNLAVNSLSFESRTTETFTLVNSTFTTSYSTNNNLAISINLSYSGYKVRLTTTGTLPAPLQINTDYYVIYKSSTSIALANTRADAYAGNEITLTSNGSGTHTVNLFSKPITVYQQDSLASSVNIGKSDGITVFQKFSLPDKFVLTNTIVIIINSITWTQVSTFVDSLPTDKHYRINPLSDNQFEVEFGNGTYGAIPPQFDIYANYSYGGGVNSNITVVNSIKTYVGGNNSIAGASNPTTLTGGADEEGIENAKNIAPMLLKTRDRFITVSDGETLVLKYGGIYTTKIIKNVYGVLTCQVVGIAAGGGDVSPALRAIVQQYLIDRTPLSSIDVRFTASIITSVNVVSAAKILPGYSFANVLPYFTLAYRLFLTETGNEIINIYENNGIAAAIAKINSIFSTSFSVADYNQIINLLDNLTPREFGDTIQSSMVYAYIQSYVHGIQYITITTFGSGLPLSLAQDEITTVGALTLTQIP